MCNGKRSSRRFRPFRPSNIEIHHKLSDLVDPSLSLQLQFRMKSCNEEALARIDAMRRQEDAVYATIDYLRQERHDEREELQIDVDSFSRRTMVEWAYRLTDFFKLDRENVEITMSYTDRYLGTPEGAVALADRKTYQLVTMAALYMAVKTHATEAMSPEMMSSLSKGVHSVKDIENMEAKILKSLDWRMNPPTAASFVREYLELTTALLNDRQKCAVYNMAKFQIEQTVGDSSFIETQTYVVAYCSLMNALEYLQLNDRVLEDIGTMLAQSVNIECNHEVIIDIQGCLLQVMLEQPDAINGTATPEELRSSSSSSSSSLQHNKLLENAVNTPIPASPPRSISPVTVMAEKLRGTHISTSPTISTMG